jgi:siroheme synthase
VISATLAGGAPADLARTAAAADTLVLLMAAERLGEVCAQLIAAGRPADEPAAVVASASTGAQRVLTGTLAGLAELAAGDAEIDPPATLVTGPSVALAGELAWFAPPGSPEPSVAAPSPPVGERSRRAQAVLSAVHSPAATP